MIFFTILLEIQGRYGEAVCQELTAAWEKGAQNGEHMYWVSIRTSTHAHGNTWERDKLSTVQTASPQSPCMANPQTIENKQQVQTDSRSAVYDCVETHVLYISEWQITLHQLQVIVVCVWVDVLISSLQEVWQKYCEGVEGEAELHKWVPSSPFLFICLLLACQLAEVLHSNHFDMPVNVFIHKPTHH